jgi:glycogen operon protein
MTSGRRESVASTAQGIPARSGGLERSGRGLRNRPGEPFGIQENPLTPKSASTVDTILPLGAAWIEEEQAYNFSLYAQHAESVVLLLFGEDDLARPLVEHRLDPRVNKTWNVWHCRLAGPEVASARYYAYCIDGPRGDGPGSRHAYDPQKVLLDPFAKEVLFPPGFDRAAARQPGSNLGRAPVGVLPRQGPELAPDQVKPPRRVASSVVIYEMHVRGFTKSPTSGVAPERRGTYAGVVDRIPYLKDLGVTVVELLPVQQFDPQEGNYWGYMTLNFFAPHSGYAADPRNAREEFRAMVRALHAAGIEVILDVVYNHTTEGGVGGPTYSFRGIDNAAYYVMSDDPRNVYRDYTGCGNSLACASICTWLLILESLRYWVTEMHVDGFRFDLASVLARAPDGSFESRDTSLLTAIRADPVLRHVHLIAEPWDAGWAYQLGTRFPGTGWCQWNGRFRDDVRRFVRGDPGMVGALMLRLYGSDDLFPDNPHDARRPFETVNYVSCHDGFTLYDAVAYNEKRNWPNGHGNTDGTSDNLSWNCGWEGDDGVPAAVMALRKRQAKNLFCVLLLANGVPMFAAGDEFLQTQRGNNNPYNQDNETTWLDWSRKDRHADSFRFVKRMIEFRKAHPALGRTHFWRDDVRWCGVGPNVDLSFDSHSVAFCLHGESQGDYDLYVMINAYHEPLDFEIQESPSGGWRRAIDTGLDSPLDIADPGKESPVASLRYRVLPRSVVVLLGVEGRT